jgi:hypothetical protein
MSGFDRRGWYVVFVLAVLLGLPAFMVASIVFDLQRY